MNSTFIETCKIWRFKYWQLLWKYAIQLNSFDFELIRFGSEWKKSDNNKIKHLKWTLMDCIFRNHLHFSFLLLFEAAFNELIQFVHCIIIRRCLFISHWVDAGNQTIKVNEGGNVLQIFIIQMENCHRFYEYINRFNDEMWMETYALTTSSIKKGNLT